MEPVVKHFAPRSHTTSHSNAVQRYAAISSQDDTGRWPRSRSYGVTSLEKECGERASGSDGFPVRNGITSTVVPGAMVVSARIRLTGRTRRSARLDPPASATGRGGRPPFASAVWPYCHAGSASRKSSPATMQKAPAFPQGLLPISFLSGLSPDGGDPRVRTYRIMLNRCTVFLPFTVMLTMYTPLAISLERLRMVLKRSPLFPNSLAKTCLP